MLATWAKAKMSGDNDGRYDYWQYQRKARVTNKEISGYNYGINEFGIKSHSYANFPLKHWVDWSPPTGGRDGDCNSVPFQVKVEYLGASGGLTFNDCDRYTTAIRNDAPGDMSVNWNAPLLRKVTGPRESGFAWIASRPQGETSYVNDYQYVRFYEAFSEDFDFCESSNSTKDC